MSTFSWRRKDNQLLIIAPWQFSIEAEKFERTALCLLYRRAIGIDASLYGPQTPETAADIANLGMLINDAGQPAAGEPLLRQALAIYEGTLGPNSDQARFVRERLTRMGR